MTPVVLCIFDRPELTEKVFRAIAEARPRRLFVVADGPRSEEEAESCRRTRAVTEEVDWDCQVTYDFSDVNLGARRRFASGLDRVFHEVDEAIVLEDDCVPDASFFPFCQAMLEHYRNYPAVMMISGGNYLERWKDSEQTYHFSCFGSTYGWATWRRAWTFYDTTMAAWGRPEVRADIRGFIGDDRVFDVQARRFDRLLSDPHDRHCWDLQWLVARLSQRGLAVVPATNLVANVGNVDGRGLAPTHPLANLRSIALPHPLRHEARVEPDRPYDRLHVERIVGAEAFRAGRAPSRRRRIALAIRRLLIR